MAMLDENQIKELNNIIDGLSTNNIISLHNECCDFDYRIYQMEDFDDVVNNSRSSIREIIESLDGSFSFDDDVFWYSIDGDIYSGLCENVISQMVDIDDIKEYVRNEIESGTTKFCVEDIDNFIQGLWEDFHDD